MGFSHNGLLTATVGCITDRSRHSVIRCHAMKHRRRQGWTETARDPKTSRFTTMATSKRTAPL